ncbi:hypothetical protein ACR301_20830 [Bacillus subtilis]|uniref:DUF2213 domain-containing protein n=1 Tax=Bacillus stercoris TaxID=2054641 RepID=A0ABU0V2F6_9BACI|nr:MULTISPECIES: hypothetical protein [Bacillus subtilis group]CUB26524.1 hypothetical protein BN2127_JRS1_08485 [Bacillus cereus]MDQ1851088.1 hypothetical protein [Bacillus stercoris]QIR18992.1 hypothetical protein F0366_12530 [Bacillus subtilis]CAF1781934.1 hypothetical protein NRS6111_03837 [Bacillus subtilis]CUB43694.1 hypothetical protein BN2127_JRS7_03368 [Bacillus subtilis]
MRSAILEINNQRKVSGRTFVKWVVLEIHENNAHYNKNGITWIEKHVNANLNSIKDMPLCVEFIDCENSEPFGHGMTEIKDGTPLFENSTVVGVTTNGYIDTIEVNGQQKRVLIGEGFIYNQRYPKFVQWLKSKMFDGEFPETSVEISAVEGSSSIEYDGGYKEKGRIPMRFDFTGDAILGIDPADDAAVLLELNNNHKEEQSMAKTQDEALVELNNKLNIENKALETKVAELNEALKKKDEELNAAVKAAKDEKAKVEEKEKEIKKAKEEKEKADAELNSLKEFKQNAENEKLKSELNQDLNKYTEKEKSVAKEKIELFSKSPSLELKTQILSEINSSIAQSFIAQRQKNQSTETNSTNDKDIFSEINDAGQESSVSINDLY